MSTNLFSFASKELSQDAIIAWILQWADPVYQEEKPQLHRLGLTLFKALLHKTGTTANPIDKGSVNIQLQWNKVDILVQWTSSEKKQVLLIEDKVRANLTDDQLGRYRKQVLRDLKVPEADLYCIFIRTTFAPPPLLDKVQSAGYTAFSVHDFYKALLPEVASIENAIVKEFWQHLTKMDADAQTAANAFEEFASLPIGKWTWWHWYGFMCSQQEEFAAGVGTQTVRRSTFLAFYYGGQKIAFRFPGDRTLQYEPYADLFFEVGKSDHTSYRMSLRIGLPGKVAETRYVREYLIAKLQPALKAKGMVTEVSQYRSSAKRTVNLLNIHLPADLTAPTLVEQLHLLQQLLMELPSEVTKEA